MCETINLKRVTHDDGRFLPCLKTRGSAFALECL